MDNSWDNLPPLSLAEPGRKLFTPAEADRSLVLVGRIVTDIVAEYQHLLELQDNLEDIQRHGQIERIRRLQEMLARSVCRLQDCLAELDDVGVELRDFTRGAVDWPAQAGGREIRLCWQLGEDRVMHWHELSEGLAERKLLWQYRPSGAAAPRT